MLQQCGDQWESSWFSPFTTWVLGIKVRLSGLAATGLATELAHQPHVQNICLEKQKAHMLTPLLPGAGKVV